MKRRSKWTCLLLAVVFLFSMGGRTAHAEEYWPEGPQIAGESAIVMEVSTGTVLYEKNSRQHFYPASITKIMTALLASEKSGLNEDVTFSHDAVFNTEGSGISRDVGEIMTMEECLYGLMLESANECAYAIAEHTGKDYDRFIRLMNKRAKKLGCKDTHFNNPHGLPDEDHWTCAYDMALISREALQNDVFRMIVNTKRYSIPPTNKHDEETYLSNHHKMLNNCQGDEQHLYEYCIGGKTGYTSVAGSTLATFAEKDGMTLVCIVMHETAPNHYLDTRALFDYCFENFRLWNIADNEKSYGQEIKESKIFESEDSFIGLSKEGYLVLPKSASFEDAKPEIIEVEDSEDVVGKIQYSYADQVVGETAIEVMGGKAPEFGFQKTKEGNAFGRTEARGQGEAGSNAAGSDAEGNAPEGSTVENASGTGAEGNAAEGDTAWADKEVEGSPAEAGGRGLPFLNRELFGVKLKHILLGVAAAIALIGVAFLLHHVMDNFYLIRYRHSVRRQQKTKLKDLKFKRRRWRKK